MRTCLYRRVQNEILLAKVLIQTLIPQGQVGARTPVRLKSEGIGIEYLNAMYQSIERIQFLMCCHCFEIFLERCARSESTDFASETISF